jgi:hypothetical protein
MTASASALRGLAAAAVLACSAALVAACGTSAAPAASPAVTATPTVSAGTASPADSPAPTPAGAAPACATSALKVTVGGPGGVAAGSSYYPVQFANVSAASCTLYGYPGVSFVTAQGGRQIGPAATRNPAMARQLVTVSPGQTVHAELQVVDAENYPAADCGLVTAHWLKVYPPNQTAPAYVSFTAPTCSKPRQILTVQTVQPGTGGS